MLHMNGSAKNQTRKGCIYAGDEGIQQQYPYKYRCREGLCMVLLLNALIPCLHTLKKKKKKKKKKTVALCITAVVYFTYRYFESLIVYRNRLCVRTYDCHVQEFCVLYLLG